MGIVTEIFSTLTEIITQVVNLIGGLFEGAVNIFYTSGESGGLTVLGVLALIGVGMGLFWLGFNFILRFIKMRG